MEPNKYPSWGLLPSGVAAQLRKRQWDNSKSLKDLLKGVKPFPLQVYLKPPSGNAILENINHFQQFIAAWRAFASSRNSLSTEVYWEERGYRHLKEQAIPTRLIIHDIAALAQILGRQEEHQLSEWQSKIAFVLTELDVESGKKKILFDALIDHLDALSKLALADLALLVKLIPQLQRGMGQNSYLRALPVTTVDTKFIESNLKVIESITAAAIDGAVKEIGLLGWLDCKDKPKDWLLVKPLCGQTRANLGGMPLLRLASDTLQEFELPAGNILVVENEQSCLALPEIANKIAVAGGGKNVTWMQAQWLTCKRVAYWGDIDSEGLSILSDARSKLGSLTPLMMDLTTVKTFQERMVAEPDSVSKTPVALTEDELVLFNVLRAKKYKNTRLEQERLPMDYVKNAISAWLTEQI
jgi:hypothetical protein